MIVSHKAADLIKQLIDADRTLADDDRRLIANVTFLQVKGLGLEINTMSAIDLLKLQSEGKLYSNETIRRSRQKLQECDPKYRGNKYNKRHQLAQEVRKEIVKVEFN